MRKWKSSLYLGSRTETSLQTQYFWWKSDKFRFVTCSKHVTCSSSLFCRSKACSASQLEVVEPVPKPVPLAQYCWDFSSAVVEDTVCVLATWIAASIVCVSSGNKRNGSIVVTAKFAYSIKNIKNKKIKKSNQNKEKC